VTDAEIAALYRRVGALGLSVASSGNVSARRPGGLAITATGARSDDAADLVVRMDLAGGYAGALRPSSEWEMHAAIYRAAPAAAVIVHTHSDAAVALACLEQPLPPFHYMVAEFGGHDVRCAPYAPFGTAELAELAAAAIDGRTACLLAHHGMICHGPSAAAALTAAVRLETLARQYLLARACGTVPLLSAAQMDDALLRYREYGQQPGDSS
jgi:L-fuculose-phosphate aldolase